MTALPLRPAHSRVRPPPGRHRARPPVLGLREPVAQYGVPLCNLSRIVCLCLGVRFRASKDMSACHDLMHSSL